MSADDFSLPAEWINTTVQVFAKTPVPAKTATGEVAITFPSFVGTLKADLPGALLLATEQGRDLLFPKANVQQMLRASDLAVVPGSTLDFLAGPHVKK